MNAEQTRSFERHIGDLESRFDVSFGELDSRFEKMETGVRDLNSRFTALGRRFEEEFEASRKVSNAINEKLDALLKAESGGLFGLRGQDLIF